MSATPFGSGAPDEVTTLRAELKAERAESRRWRQLAEQRTAALTGLRRRPLVRAALALDRRVEQPRRLVGRVRADLGRRTARTLLTAGGVVRRPWARRRSADLDRSVRDLAPAVSPERSVSVVVLGASPEIEIGDDRSGLEVLGSGDAEDWFDAAAHNLAVAKGDVVCLLAPGTNPVSPDWLDRLVDVLGDGVVAAVPTLVHPVRPPARATPHDGLVRSMGLDIVDRGDGSPVVRARQAGTRPEPSTSGRDVSAGSSACVVLDRWAAIAAGGLGPVTDPDAAVVELCARLRHHGGEIRTVPDAVLVDGRPVASRPALTHPIDDDGEAWRAVLDRAGPLLVDAGTEAPAVSFALTVASPSTKVAARWGDWHLAEALARSLRRGGHRVRVQTANRADDPAGRCCEVHLVLRGLAPVRRTSGQCHVLWVISHPESVEPEELDAADLVLVASARFAEALRKRTTTPVEVLLQATDHRRFWPRPVEADHNHPVTVVAKTREVIRPMVVDALAAGLRPAIYGSGWTELVDPSLVVSEEVENEELPVVYSSAGVVLNDHWETMRFWGFVSNRIFDVLACGTPVISDHLPEMDGLFGDAVTTVSGPRELAAAVATVREDRAGAHRRAAAGRRAVLAAHTFDHRAEELADALARHGLDRGPIA